MTTLSQLSRSHDEIHVVTGAFGYTGAYITRRLLADGKRVLTLTNHPHSPNPYGDRVDVAPLDFGNFDQLVSNLEGATALYNTYWIRFPSHGITHEDAVANTQIMLRAARQARVGKLVHLSITRANRDSRLSYFRGKAVVEEAIADAGIPFAIIRPTVIFGPEDILINNIAWLLRRFPIFAIPGSGNYQLQPVFIEDIASIAVEASRSNSNVYIDAAGPETYTFDQLVRLIARTVGSRARIVHVSPQLALAAASLIGMVQRDVTLTRDEIEGLSSNLLIATRDPAGRTLLSEWLRANANTIGSRYASEMARR